MVFNGTSMKTAQQYAGSGAEQLRIRFNYNETAGAPVGPVMQVNYIDNCFVKPANNSQNVSSENAKGFSNCIVKDHETVVIRGMRDKDDRKQDWHVYILLSMQNNS